jgi:hypothetical protein
MHAKLASRRRRVEFHEAGASIHTAVGPADGFIELDRRFRELPHGKNPDEAAADSCGRGTFSLDDGLSWADLLARNRLKMSFEDIVALLQARSVQGLQLPATPAQSTGWIASDKAAMKRFYEPPFDGRPQVRFSRGLRPYLVV